MNAKTWTAVTQSENGESVVISADNRLKFRFLGTSLKASIRPGEEATSFTVSSLGEENQGIVAFALWNDGWFPYIFR